MTVNIIIAALVVAAVMVVDVFGIAAVTTLYIVYKEYTQYNFQ